MKINDLHTLYVHELKDLYSAENQILKALPKMIDEASDEGLRAALRTHLRETETHVQRITSLFKSLDFEPGGHKCKGVEGLIAEASESLRDVEDDATRDAAIISGAQRVEHYEMAAYGVARAFARKLGREEDVAVLTQTLEEEGAADRILTELAEQRINFFARVT